MEYKEKIRYKIKEIVASFTLNKVKIFLLFLFYASLIIRGFVGYWIDLKHYIIKSELHVEAVTKYVIADTINTIKPIINIKPIVIQKKLPPIKIPTKDITKNDSIRNVIYKKIGIILSNEDIKKYELNK